MRGLTNEEAVCLLEFDRIDDFQTQHENSDIEEILVERGCLSHRMEYEDHPTDPDLEYPIDVWSLTPIGEMAIRIHKKMRR